MEVVYLIDSSSSVSPDEFNAIKNYIANDLETLDLEKGKTYVTSVSYGDTLSRVRGNDLLLLQQGVRALRQQSGVAQHAQALEKVLEDMIGKTEFGDNTGKLVVLFKKDKLAVDDDKTLKAAAQLHKREVTTVVVGFGDNIDMSELAQIAGSKGQVVVISDVDDLPMVMPYTSKAISMLSGKCILILLFFVSQYFVCEL